MNALWKDPLNDLVGGFLSLDLVEAATEPRLREDSKSRFKPQLGIRLATARQLQLRGFGTVGALYWRGIDWFANTRAIWLSDELRDEILEEMVAFNKFVGRFKIIIPELLFWHVVKLPGEYLPGSINPAGEFVVNPQEKHDCDALPWRDSWEYEQQFAEQNREGHVGDV